jgi:uncharacterized membrane protein
MFGAGFCNFSFWWLIPVGMMALCFFMMRRRTGSRICGFGSHNKDSHSINPSDSAIDILDKQYATGIIDEKEYEKRKIILAWDK